MSVAARASAMRRCTVGVAFRRRMLERAEPPLPEVTHWEPVWLPLGLDAVLIRGTSVPQPALATLTHERFWDDGWVYERKLDGQRCLAVRDGRGTRLYSRSGRDVTVAFPEIAEALERQASERFVIDGEVVAFEGSRTSFARLQPRIHVNSAEKARRSGVPVYFYLFDVLSVDGDDVRGEPLLDRKRGCARCSRSTGRSARRRTASARRGGGRSGSPSAADRAGRG